MHPKLEIPNSKNSSSVYFRVQFYVRMTCQTSQDGATSIYTVSTRAKETHNSTTHIIYAENFRVRGPSLARPAWL